MKWLESRILWGSLLIIGGVLFLLENLNVIEFSGLFWALLFVLGAVFFLSIFMNNRMNWWAIIPGIILLCIGIAIAIDYLVPQAAEFWAGAVVLGGIGLSFAIIYLINRTMWWAIIPAGAMFSLAVMLALEYYFPGDAIAGVFLIGLGLTFAFVAIAPVREGRMWWAWIPAGALVLTGLVLTASAGNVFQYVWPLALIIGGGALIFYTLRPRKSE
jgi:hypothetical protein